MPQPAREAHSRGVRRQEVTRTKKDIRMSKGGSRGRGARGRVNISASSVRRMALGSTNTSTEESLVIMSSYYRRYDDGCCPDDGHSYWSYQRRAQMINSCYERKAGRFRLGVHSKRLLAITELASELVGQSGERWDMVEQVEHSVVKKEEYLSDEEDDKEPEYSA